MRKINEIIVHCSATRAGMDYTTEDIDRWHRQRGFDCIGYHYVVYRDGSIHGGRSEGKAGAHCAGHNRNSIGVCYIGGLSADGQAAEDTRTERQRASLLSVLRMLKKKYPSARIHGHRDFAKKACPCFDAAKEYSGL